MTDCIKFFSLLVFELLKQAAQAARKYILRYLKTKGKKDMNKLLLSILMPAIKTIGAAELKNVLDKLALKNTDADFTNALKAIHSSFSLLLTVANDTKTKIDDGIIEAVLQAVEDAATDKGIVL